MPESLLPRITTLGSSVNRGNGSPLLCYRPICEKSYSSVERLRTRPKVFVGTP
jgi:hypothetical protein